MPVTDAPTFDYIIAGAGSAGCVLAARLCEDPTLRVLLIEAGRSRAGVLSAMPAALGMVQADPDYDWAYRTIAQPTLGGRRIAYPRGKGVGGSSLINGMIYIRGNPGDFDRWAAAGLAGWGYADVLPYFRRSARAAHRIGSPFHSADGRIAVTPARNFNDLDERFVAAARDAGAEIQADFNGPRQDGVGRLDLMVDGGVRQSAARAYLRRRPTNLRVEAGTRLLRILTDGRRAVGVNTTAGRFSARREVILALGAFETPKALLLSGIGPATRLQAMGLDVIADLPGVGHGLADHPNVPMQVELSDPADSFARFQQPLLAASVGARWLLTRTGPAAAPFWSTALFHRLGADPLPDLEVFFMSLMVREVHARARSNLWQRVRRAVATLVTSGKVAVPGLQFDINLLRPHSRGSVTLDSLDPIQAPRIDCGYLTDERDIRALVAGIRHIRAVVHQPPLRARAGAEVSPGSDLVGDADLAAYVRDRVITGHHPACTARMGPDGDPLAVVDGQFRVRGIDRLRVVDAAAMPDMVSGNIHATVVMMAERAADMIRGRPTLPPEDPRVAQP